LRILTETLAYRLILANQSVKGDIPVVRGVELLHEGTRHSVFAKREVILSAGSLGSPQILEQSGIGDSNVLSVAGIPCHVHNPDIGKNLQEHVMSAVVYELAPGLETIDSLLNDATLLQVHQKLYAETYSGALSGSVSLTGCISYSDCVSKAELEKSMDNISSSSLETRSSKE
jgi:choline dehydrogenase-like flavoprotein